MLVVLIADCTRKTVIQQFRDVATVQERMTLFGACLLPGILQGVEELVVVPVEGSGLPGVMYSFPEGLKRALQATAA